MSKVRSSLDFLSKKDTYSLLMFVLFKLNQDPSLSVLSQLVYLLDENSLIKLLKYFGGQTITLPTVDELKRLIHTLTLYKRVDIDGEEIDFCLDSIPSGIRSEVVQQYESVKKLMEEYSFC